MFNLGKNRKKNIGTKIASSPDSMHMSLTVEEMDSINISRAQFVNSNVKSTMQSIVDDVLLPYRFDLNEESVIQSIVKGVYPYANKNIMEKTLTIRDICVLSMLGEKTIISSVNLNTSNIGKKKMALVAGDLDQGQVDYGMGFVKPEKSLCMDSFYDASDIGLLKLCFGSLLNAYKRQDRLEAIDSKLVFKMEGFHSLFTQPKSFEEMDVAQEQRENLVENFNQILHGQSAIIGENDSLGFITNYNNRSSVNGPSEAIYCEISRILGVPQSRLLGRAPQGMNATGEYDHKNYEMLLNTFRSYWLEAVLDFFDIQYIRVEESDIEKTKEIVKLFDLAKLDLPDSLKEKIKNFGE